MEEGVDARLATLIEETRTVADTDKSDRYLAIYEEFLGPRRDRPLRVVEVGVREGGSLLLLARYLERARLLGVDIRPPSASFTAHLGESGLSERVAFRKGSQDDPRFLTNAIRAWFGGDEVDVVIDDASHLYRPTRATFEHLFPNHLVPGGLYVLEDWGCGYWPKWRDGHPGGRRGLPRLVKEMVDEVAREDRTKLFKGKRALRADGVEPSSIARMTVVSGIVVLERA